MPSNPFWTPETRRLIVKCGPCAAQGKLCTEHCLTAENRQAGGRTLHCLKYLNMHIIEHDDPIGVCQFYENQSSVAFAEPNMRFETMATPNDPSYSGQYGFPLISCPQAWDLSKGETVIKLGDLDSGTDLNHPDLRASIYKTLDPNNNPSGAQVNGSAHGVHTHGTIGAVTNNAIGVAGMNWKCRMYLVKCYFDSWANTSSNGSIDLGAAVAGINWFIQEGVWAYNMSFGGPSSASLQSAIQSAYAKWIIPCAAMGNSSDSTISYPGGYPECIAVCAVDSSGTRASFSTFNNTAFISGPGVSVNSTWYTASWNSSSPVGSTYALLSGTSMATPHITGLVGLMMAMNATASPTEIKNALSSTATAKADPNTGVVGYNSYYGYGLANAYRALQKISGKI